jgi:hypothetical protein
MAVEPHDLDKLRAVAEAQTGDALPGDWPAVVARHLLALYPPPPPRRPTSGASTSKVRIGRIVIYRSRTGNYSCPAIVTATVDTLAEVGVRRYEDTGGHEGVPPLTSEMHVHLTVFTPGLPGLRVEAQDFKAEGVRRAENVGGLYQEWDVPFALYAALGVGFVGDPTKLAAGADPPVIAEEYPVQEQPPGTWAWPVIA